MYSECCLDVCHIKTFTDTDNNLCLHHYEYRSTMMAYTGTALQLPFDLQPYNPCLLPSHWPLLSFSCKMDDSDWRIFVHSCRCSPAHLVPHIVVNSYGHNSDEAHHYQDNTWPQPAVPRRQCNVNEAIKPFNLKRDPSQNIIPLLNTSASN